MQFLAFPKKFRLPASDKIRQENIGSEIDRSNCGTKWESGRGQQQTNFRPFHKDSPTKFLIRQENIGMTLTVQIVGRNGSRGEERNGQFSAFPKKVSSTRASSCFDKKT